MVQRVETLDLPVPLSVALRAPLPVSLLDLVIRKGLVEGLQGGAGVSHEGQAGVLVGVEVGDVYVDEANVGVLESGFRGRREVAPTGADPDDEVGLAGRAVGGGSAGGANSPEGERVVVEHSALAGLRLGDRDAGLFGEAPQGLRRIRVDRAPA